MPTEFESPASGLASPSDSPGLHTISAATQSRTRLATGGKMGDAILLGLLAVFGLVTAILPVASLFYRFQTNINEGWNVYNQLAVSNHLPLYPAKYAWTEVNYPALYFYVVAHLAWLTPNLLSIGRVLSLVSFALCIVLIAAIIRKLTTGVAPALFGASFCLVLFCTQGPRSIGVDEPNMLAYACFLGGFLLYLSKRDRLNFGWIAATVLLFVIGGNIKHNPIDFPLTVFVDLCLLSRRRAAQYLAAAAPLIALTFYITKVVAGPFFLSSILLPRGYDLSVDFPPAVILPFVVALFWSLWQCRTGARKLILEFFLVSAFVGFAFSFGIGVSVNTFFTNFFAISIVMGLLLEYLWQRTPTRLAHRWQLWRWGVPVALCPTLVLSFGLSGHFHVIRDLQRLRARQASYNAEIAFMKDHPGPAICEGLLHCYDSGKPYLYDAFNATCLVRFHKLNPNEMAAAIDTHRFSTIQMQQRVETYQRDNERFANELLDAIKRNYVLGLDEPDAAIYVPKAGNGESAASVVR